MPRLTLAATLALFTACAPKDPASTATDGDASTSEATTAASTTSTATATSTATTDAASTSTPITTGEPATTGDSTSAASSSGATTSVEPLCPWSGHEGLVFCPPPAAMNAMVSGTTPYGPVELHYAHFGLFMCATCPDPAYYSLRLYADPPSLGEPTGDYIALENFELLHVAEFNQPGSIAGQTIDILPVDLMLADPAIPTTEQTAPPLDEAMPPVLSGTLHITGNGWDVHGTVDATLCTELNWTVFCE